MPADSRGSSWKPQPEPEAGHESCRRRIPVTTIGELQIGQFSSITDDLESNAAASASVSTEPTDRTPAHLGLSLQSQIPALS